MSRSIKLKNYIMGTRNRNSPPNVKSRILDMFHEYFTKFGWYRGIGVFYPKDKPLKASGFYISVLHNAAAPRKINGVRRANGKVVGLKRTVFVRGIPANMDEDSFYTFFSGHGTIVEYEIIEGVHGGTPTYGFIIFDSRRDANSLVKKARNGLITMEGSKVTAKKVVVDKIFPDPGSIFLYDCGVGDYDSDEENAANLISLESGSEESSSVCEVDSNAGCSSCSNVSVNAAHSSKP